MRRTVQCGTTDACQPSLACVTAMGHVQPAGMCSARKPLASAMSQAEGWVRRLTTSVCAGSISSGELEAPLLSLMRMTWQSAGLVPPVARNCLQ